MKSIGRKIIDLLRFNGMRVPSTDFAAVRSDLQVPYLTWEIDLSTARSVAAGTALQLPLNGNSLYIDQAPDVGYAYCWLNEQRESRPVRLYMQPGFNCDIPFDYITFENDAQVGKVLRIFYGVDIDFKPGIGGTLNVAGTVAISGIVSTQETRYLPGAVFVNATAMTANQWQQAFTPASNVNGAILHQAQAWTYSAAGNRLVLTAHTTSPNGVTVGEVLFATQNYPTSVTQNTLRCWPRTIPAGKGLYWYSESAETAASTWRMCEYTLL